VRSVLAGRDPQVTLSRHAQARLAELREEMPFCAADYSALVTDDAGTIRRWTFAGLGANAVLAQRLGAASEQVKRFDNFSVQFEREPSAPLKSLVQSEMVGAAEPAWEDWMDQFELKVQLCLSTQVAQAVTVARLPDPSPVPAVQREPIRRFRLR
jgi:ATP-dependent Lhr-like helicase